MPTLQSQIPSNPYLQLDHISSVRPAKGRMVVASGNPLRHLDWFSGKHFILKPSGVRLEPWLVNPQFWWRHDGNIPLGTSDLSLETNEGKPRLVADNIRFHRMKIPVSGFDLGEFDTGIIADLYEMEVIRASSVQVFFTADDMDRMYEDEHNVYLPTSELIEWSLVTAPADRDAVRLSLDGMGVNDKLMQLILSDQLRLKAAERPVSVVAPAQEKNEMEEDQVPQEELEAAEAQQPIEMGADVINAVAGVVVQNLIANEAFVSDLAEKLGHVMANSVNDAIGSMVNTAVGAAMQSQKAVPAVPPVAQPEPTALRLVLSPEVVAKTNPVVEAKKPAPATPKLEPNHNQPAARHAFLAGMTYQR